MKRKKKNILMEPNDVLTGPVINSIVTDDDEPLPSLSDFHDYEPNLEFDDSELTHPPLTNGMYCTRTSPKKCVDKIASSFTLMHLFLYHSRL